jgi:hypothetical protein
MGLNTIAPFGPRLSGQSAKAHLTANGEANMKWKLRLARHMAQEAFVVIEPHQRRG